MRWLCKRLEQFGPKISAILFNGTNLWISFAYVFLSLYHPLPLTTTATKFEETDNVQRCRTVWHVSLIQDRMQIVEFEKCKLRSSEQVLLDIFFQFTVEVKCLHWSRTCREANTWSRLLWFVDCWNSVSEESNVQICMFWKFDAPSVWQTDEIANSQLWWVLFLVCLSGVCLFWTKALKERTLWSVLTTSITDQEEEYKKIF